MRWFGPKLKKFALSEPLISSNAKSGLRMAVAPAKVKIVEKPALFSHSYEFVAAASDPRNPCGDESASSSP
jgi:hypothetical protein